VNGGANLNILAVARNIPFPHTDAGALGSRYGFERITPAQGVKNGPFYAFMATSNCVIHGDTRFSINVRTDKTEASIGGLAVPAGVTLPAPFERIRLSEGEGVAYWT
jgi:hypothetical protein